MVMEYEDGETDNKDMEFALRDGKLKLAMRAAIHSAHQDKRLHVIFSSFNKRHHHHTARRMGLCFLEQFKVYLILNSLCIPVTSFIRPPLRNIVQLLCLLWDS